MGSIEQIDQLETYINDLGVEVERVKKVSEYLRLIEQFQNEIQNTSSVLNESKDQLKFIQEIVESKLELFQTTTKNIESKQQILEQYQLHIIESLSKLIEQQDRNEKGTINSFKEVNKLVIYNQNVFMGELNQLKEEQKSLLHVMSKTNKIFFAINSVLVICVLGILLMML